MRVATINLTREQDTDRLGMRLAECLVAGDVVRLEGPLGAGKTTLARAVIRALVGPVTVPSPTFTLVETYEAPDFGVWHFDLYRLEKPGDIWELGAEEAFDDAVSLIEWPERAGDKIPANAMTVALSLREGGRVAILSGSEDWAARIAAVASDFENRLETSHE
jgi:tRNA threonylcarbamoyladenosine biosynthesis protein TsaE